MCWNVATAPLDNNVVLGKKKKKKNILYLDLFLWENGFYCDPVSTHSCQLLWQPLCSLDFRGKGSVAGVHMLIFVCHVAGLLYLIKQGKLKRVLIYVSKSIYYLFAFYLKIQMRVWFIFSRLVLWLRCNEIASSKLSCAFCILTCFQEHVCYQTCMRSAEKASQSRWKIKMP